MIMNFIFLPSISTRLVDPWMRRLMKSSINRRSRCIHGENERKRKRAATSVFCQSQRQNNARRASSSTIARQRRRGVFFLNALCQKVKRLRLAGFYTSGFKNLAFNPESTAKSVHRALKLKSRHMLVWEEFGSGGLSTPGPLPGLITSIG